MDHRLVLIAAAILALSGLPRLLAGRRSSLGAWLETALVLMGATTGLCGVVLHGLHPEQAALSLPWLLPWGRLNVAIDGVSAVFLVPVFLVPALGSIYGLRYWRQSEHPENGRKLGLFYGLLAGSMVMVVVARDGILFLMAWEVMALSAFFLVTTEDDDPAVCRAGWIYLVATHAGTLCLFAMFGLLRLATGSLAIDGALPDTVPSGLATAIFLLALCGFGLKAGVMPLHVWLPGAHANAPTHVSAVLSGVMIKMGIYGIVRITGLFPHPPIAWGGLVLAFGAASGLLGIVFAIAQHDIKRLLAYCSIENIGIILMGVGLAMIGRSLDRPDWIVLGLGGALLHVWNHGLFKSLLFLASGSVIHAVHTRKIDRMGGLAKQMPWTAAAFLVGAVAICGLPPLNGFVSELLIYLGLFSTIGIDERASCVAAGLAVPVLAMIGALAVACFVKAFGSVFLGEGRSERACHAHESPRAMLIPMAVLAACCFAIGLAPTLVAPMFDRAVAAWAPTSSAAVSLASLAPLQVLSSIGAVLLFLIVAGIALLRRRMLRGASDAIGTWDCGYAAPTPRMQYTASSFAQILVDLFTWVLRPRKHRPHVDGPLPPHSHFESHCGDTALDGVMLPAFRSVTALSLWLRSRVRGRSQLYIFYILVVIVILFIVASSTSGVSQ